MCTYPKIGNLFVGTPEIAFGNALRKLRERTGLSQEDFADQCGLDRTYVGILERGKKSPTLRTMLKICVCLEISFTRLAAAIEKEQS